MRLRFERGRRDDLKTLHPACFAMVMATGIVAISAHLHDMPVVAALLFWLNALFLAGLLAATGARLLRYPRDVAADLRSHSRGVGFFTIVAALAVFGTQLDLQRGEARLAAVFWAVAAILWAVMTYGVLAPADGEGRQAPPGRWAEWRLAGHRRGAAVGRPPDGADRGARPVRRPRAKPDVPGAGAVAGRRGALSLADHDSDLLPLHLRGRSRRPTSRQPTGSTWAPPPSRHSPAPRWCSTPACRRWWARSCRSPRA